MALLLIREKVETFEDVKSNIKFTSLHSAPDTLLQGIINSLCAKLGFNADDEVTFEVVGGRTYIQGPSDRESN